MIDTELLARHGLYVTIDEDWMLPPYALYTHDGSRVHFFFTEDGCMAAANTIIERSKMSDTYGYNHDFDGTTPRDQTHDVPRSIDPFPKESFDSASDKRVTNNVMRHEYRVLTENEKTLMKAIKDKGLEFCELLNHIAADGPTSDELKNADMRTQEAVFWAVKHITR